MKPLTLYHNSMNKFVLWKREHSGSVVESLIWGRGLTGFSLTGTTVLSLSKTHLSLLSSGSIQEDPFWHNWKIVNWDVKNQIK